MLHRIVWSSLERIYQSLEESPSAVHLEKRKKKKNKERNRKDEGTCCQEWSVVERYGARQHHRVVRKAMQLEDTEDQG
jgi:hypothetical protein